MSNPDGGEQIKERSSWLLPLAVIVAVLSLSTVFLYYYFGPTVDELTGRAPSATESAEKVEIAIAGNEYRIPANYTRYKAERTTGDQESVSMFALLPDFEPYSQPRQEEFQSNAADAKVIHFSIEQARGLLPGPKRFELVHRKNLVDADGAEGPYGLRQYEFNENAAFAGQDLFTHPRGPNDLVILICARQTELVPSPNCRCAVNLDDRVVMKYRFKRAHLEQWEEIDNRLISLVRSFEVAG